MPLSIESVFGFVPLMKAIEEIPSGIPKILPDWAYRVTDKVVGDKFRHFRYRGTRKAARVLPYGAPPRTVTLLGRSVQDIVLLHTFEKVQFRQELLTSLMDWMGGSYTAQVMARDEIRLQAKDFKTRFDTLRTAAIHNTFASAVLYFDVDGNLLSSSSGAVLTIDQGVKASHKGQIDPGTGALVSASWATASTDIPTQVAQILKYAIQESSRPITTAIYGANIPGYIANNDKAKYWLARNPGINQAYANSPSFLPAGLFGIANWVPGINAFWETDAGVIAEPFPADQITLLPDLTEDVYGIIEGSYVVPGDYNPKPSIDAALAALTLVYGMFEYARVDLLDIPQSTFLAGDTFIPWLKVPDAVFLVDTTP